MIDPLLLGLFLHLKQLLRALLVLELYAVKLPLELGDGLYILIGLFDLLFKLRVPEASRLVGLSELQQAGLEFGHGHCLCSLDALRVLRRPLNHLLLSEGLMLPAIVLLQGLYVLAQREDLLPPGLELVGQILGLLHGPLEYLLLDLQLLAVQLPSVPLIEEVIGVAQFYRVRIISAYFRSSLAP
jgi:hypothetical protein